MNISAWKKSCIRVLPAIVLLVAGGTVFSSQGGVTQTYKNAVAPFDDEAMVDPVASLPDGIVQVKESYQGGIFWTLTRKDKIQRFACTQCHNNLEVKRPRAAEIAHGAIRLDHGGEGKPLQCFTCHKHDERDLLITEKGVTMDMDHSYQLCGQCHFRQKKDWVGGAHGKRVSHWAGKRVVWNCTSCHNPHSPRFEKRWPSTYSLPLD